MTKKSKQSKVTGASNAEAGKQPLAMLSSSEEPLSNILGMLGRDQIQEANQIGFQPTPALVEIDETTANVQVLTAFAVKLAKLVEWRRLELADGREVIALCFPLGVWQISPNGTLVLQKDENKA